MSTWYEVKKYSDEPLRVEVENSTGHFLILPNGRRAAKSSEYASYYPTLTQALAVLITRTENKIKNAQRVIDEQSPILAGLQRQYDDLNSGR